MYKSEIELALFEDMAVTYNNAVPNYTPNNTQKPCAHYFSASAVENADNTDDYKGWFNSSEECTLLVY